MSLSAVPAGTIILLCPFENLLSHKQLCDARSFRFRAVLKAAKGNQRRVRAVGFDPCSYQLVAYVVAGSNGRIAGILDANFTSFVTSEFLSWKSSAELIFIGGGVLRLPVRLLARWYPIDQELLGGLTIGLINLGRWD